MHVSVMEKVKRDAIAIGKECFLIVSELVWLE